MKKNNLRSFLLPCSVYANRRACLLPLALALLLGFCTNQSAFAQTFSAGSLPAAIPDPGSLTRSITVSGLPGTVATANEVQVDFNVAHLWAGDVVVGITPPGGSEILVVRTIGTNSAGCYSNSDFIAGNDIHIRQNAAGVIPGQNNITIPAGTYLPTGCTTNPVGSLASLIGATRNGDWTIRVADNEGIVQGTLHAASITFDFCNTPTGITLANPSACNAHSTTCGTDDTFTADVTVTFSSIPASGTLTLTSPTLVGTVTPVDVASLSGTSHTFTGVSFQSTGAAVSVTATFSAACSFTNATAGTAPASCSTPPPPSPVTVSGFDVCTELNGQYVPSGTLNGFPVWVNANGDFIYWSSPTGPWSLFSVSMQSDVAFNGTDCQPAYFLPCNNWVEYFECTSSGSFTVSGACGSNTNPTPPNITGISVANVSSCNDNGTPGAADDYFTADVTLTFAFAPAGGTLRLVLQGSTMTIPTDDFICTTTYTFEDLQMAATGQPVTFAANFSGQSCNNIVGTLMTAPATCSCPISGISLANPSAANCQNTTCTTDDTFTADITVSYVSKPATGTLALTGVNIIGTVPSVNVSSIGATSYTFTNVTMKADGDDVDLTATFSAGCNYNDNEVATAPSCDAEFVPSNITVSGFGCFGPNGNYTPNGIYNGAPQWSSDYGPGNFSIRWTGIKWELYFNSEGYAMSENTTGSITNLPCTGGWTDPIECLASPLTLTGGCGSLEAPTPSGSTSDISMANASACNDNGTTDPSDDYFTADITVTFAFAPCDGNLILNYGTGSKPGGAKSLVDHLAEIDACLLSCVTTYTFEDVELAADGQPVVLTAYFSEGVGEVQQPVGTAPQSCSCVPPTFTLCPMNQSVNTASNTCTAILNYTATADGAPAPEMTYTFNGITMGSGSGSGTGSAFNLGVTTVSLVANNDCGAPTCEFTVTVTDATPPLAKCKNVTLDLNASGTATLTAGQVNNGSTDNCGNAQLLGVQPSTFNCANVWATNSATLTVGDGNGNSATCTATVTVRDKTKPTVACKPYTVLLGPDGTATVKPSDVYSEGYDNCTTVSLLKVVPGSLNCNHTAAPTTVTLTVFDASGNQSTCKASVTVKDGTKPEILCRDRTVPLGANGTAAIVPADVYLSGTDNCGKVNLQGVSPSTFICTDLGTVPVTLTANDGKGNTATCTATVTIADATAPTALCRPATVVLDDEGNGSLSSSAIDNGSTDNCAVAGISLSKETFGCADAGSVPVTLTVTDASDNTSTCTATVTVLDVSPPVAVCRADTLIVTLDTNALYSIVPDSLDAGSTDACGLGTLAAGPASLTCAQEGFTSVHLVVADPAGNADTCSATVRVLPYLTLDSIALAGEGCAGDNDGDIKIFATSLGGQIGYSIDGGTNFQFVNNTFGALQPGTYHVVVKVFGIQGVCEKRDTVEVLPGSALATWHRDMDGDGYSDGTTITSCSLPPGHIPYPLPGTDCNDNDPGIHPGATEACNGLDDNCDGTVPADELDTDNDGLRVCSGDCNDGNANIHPGAAEVCNGVDDDCDGSVDENLSGETFSGNVTFSNQAQVDAWPQCYTVVAGNVTVTGTNITDLGPLSNLVQVTGNLRIISNPNLETLDGLGNLTLVGGVLHIYYNFKLDDCCALHGLVNGGVAGSIVIFYNKVGCNSVAQINTECGGGPAQAPLVAGVPATTTAAMAGGGDVPSGALVLYPNPTEGAFTAVFPSVGVSGGTLRLTDVFGRTIYHETLPAGSGNLDIDLSTGRFAPGVYLATLTKGDGTTLTGQLVVKR